MASHASPSDEPREEVRAARGERRYSRLEALEIDHAHWAQRGVSVRRRHATRLRSPSTPTGYDLRVMATLLLVAFAPIGMITLGWVAFVATGGTMTKAVETVRLPVEAVWASVKRARDLPPQNRVEAIHGALDAWRPARSFAISQLLLLSLHEGQALESRTILLHVDRQATHVLAGAPHLIGGGVRTWWEAQPILRSGRVEEVCSLLTASDMRGVELALMILDEGADQQLWNPLPPVLEVLPVLLDRAMDPAPTTDKPAGPRDVADHTTWRWRHPDRRLSMEQAHECATRVLDAMVETAPPDLREHIAVCLDRLGASR